MVAATMTATAPPLNRKVRTFGGGPKAAHKVGEVRRFIVSCLGVDHPCFDDACVCVTELVTNALKHTRSGSDQFWFCWFRVSVTWTETSVRLAVEDTGAMSLAVPTKMKASAQMESGRGLAIVDWLADNWHVMPGSMRNGHLVTVFMREETRSQV